VDTFTGGTRSAMRRLGEFLKSELAAYDTNRNHPEIAGTSRLSPYLHFGNIGPLTIARAVEDAARSGKVPPKTSERYLEQLIGWRELAILFVRHEPSYDTWECAAPWARRTLLEHASDPRPYKYTFAQLERAETYDDLWNAAQREMTVTGWMHNYMRMYWAKKILEWAPDPATAFDWAVILNDRYQLDGRDPNGYAGIAWAIVGKLDRLRTHSLHDGRLDGEEVRLCRLHPPARRTTLSPAIAALPPLYPESHGALLAAVL
jgi:deoxyribodipyrimidine photo-lyase